jgi:hypothetical protein
MERISYGGLDTTYVVVVPLNSGRYHVLPHCTYVVPLTSVVVHDDGTEYTTDPAVAATAPTAAALATGR